MSPAEVAGTLGSRGREARLLLNIEEPQLFSEIVPKLHAALAARSALEWEAHFGDAVPCAAARTVEDMFDFPQVEAEDMVQTFDHPVVGRYRGFTRGWTFGRTPGPEAFTAPALDQHGDALRREADRYRDADRTACSKPSVTVTGIAGR